MFRRIATVFALIAALAVSASASSIDMSDSASLDSLLNGGSLNLGSITIDNFAQLAETINPGAGTATPVDPAAVDVQAQLVCGNKINLFFNGFVASASNGGQYDYLMGFDISNTAGIGEVTLSQVGGGVGQGNVTSFVNITELVVDNNNILNSVQLTTDDSQPTALGSLGGGATTISVTKDILVQSFAGESAQISQFSQMYMMVPEPSALGLGFFGLLGAFGMSRRRRRQS